MQTSIQGGETSIFALGGLGEVGKNLYCIEQEDTIILIDAGIRFPEDDLPGVDYVIPDFTYLVRNQFKIKALIITHGHEDHIGGIPFLIQKVNIPMIYTPRLAAGLIRHKLEENRKKDKCPLTEITSDTVLKIDMFEISFFNMTHSIPDALGVCINTPNGKIMTTGDFKIDLTPVGQEIDLQKIAMIGQSGVDLLLSDSTNAEVEGMSISEQFVVSSINDIFRNCDGRLFVATFASNIHRIQQIVEAAVKFKRKILIFGRSMEKTIEIGRKYGYIKCPDNYFITPETLKYVKSSELLIICTGSQGEPLAALSRIANDSHKFIKIFPGDTVVFSSSPIPGNASSVNRVINSLSRRGANVLTNSVLTNLHASGHASQEELKIILTLVKPKYFMPIHGEYRMLKIHASIAQSLGMPKENTFVLSNGDVLHLKKGQVRQGRRVQTDDIYVDGRDTSGLSTAVIRDRKILASDGVLSVLVTMDSRQNKLLSCPKIVSRGFMYFSENDPFFLEAEKIVETALTELLKGRITFMDIKNSIRDNLSRYIYEKTNRNPIIIPLLMNQIDKSLPITNPSITGLKTRKRKPNVEKQ